MESVSEEEKISASEKLSSTIDAYVKGHTELLNRIVWYARIKITLMLLCLSAAMYLIFLKSDTQKERQQLIDQRAMLIKDKENFIKDKVAFIRLKFVQDSTYTSLMSNIFKQDSISGLNRVIKADVVNAKTVNTVNTKSVNVKK